MQRLLVNECKLCPFMKIRVRVKSLHLTTDVLYVTYKSLVITYKQFNYKENAYFSI